MLQDRFPDPKGLADELHSKGFNGIWMLNPGIHIDKGYAAYNNGSEEDVWVQTPDGKPYIGKYLNFLCFWNICMDVKL